MFVTGEPVLSLRALADTRNLEPGPPAALSTTLLSHPWAIAILSTIANPNPVPSSVDESPGSKTVSSASAGMPGPSSATENPSAIWATRMVTSPSRCSTAFRNGFSKS
jgi:hypothetical protein